MTAERCLLFKDTLKSQILILQSGNRSAFRCDKAELALRLLIKQMINISSGMRSPAYGLYAVGAVSDLCAFRLAYKDGFLIIDVVMILLHLQRFTDSQKRRQCIIRNMRNCNKCTCHTRKPLFTVIIIKRTVYKKTAGKKPADMTGRSFLKMILQDLNHRSTHIYSEYRNDLITVRQELPAFSACSC